jgi:AmmeMemoRadiSam system protein A
MTIEASVKDPRFSPITPGELKHITIEISVLSDFIKVNSLDEIVVGRDGLLIRKGFNSGLLLPQVPGEWGWDKETYLKQLCLKAGLPATAYRDKNAAFYRFTAFVFGEGE